MTEHLDAGKKSAEEIQEEKQIRSREGEGKREKRQLMAISLVEVKNVFFTISKNIKFCCTLR